MDKPTINTLALRLERLEHENCNLRRQARWSRRLGVAGTLGAAVALIAGAHLADGPKTLEAQRLVIKGNDGKVYAELGVSEHPNLRIESPDLTLFDQQGKRRVQLSVGPNGDPLLRFNDEDGRSRCEFHMLPSGNTQVGFYDQSGWGQLTLGTFDDGAALKLLGPDGAGRGGRDHGGLSVALDGSTKLHLFRPGGVDGQDTHERVELGVRPDGSTVMALRGADFPGGLRAQVSPDGAPRLKLLDALGKSLLDAPQAH